MKMHIVLGLVIALFLANACAVHGTELWITDFEEAKRQAAEKNLSILANFTGSDWCYWCKKLDKDVFSKPEFAEFAQKNFVLFKADFPRFKRLPTAEAEQNEALRRKYNVPGFPTLLVLNAQGEVQAVTGFKRGGVQPYIQHLEEILSKARSGQAE